MLGQFASETAEQSQGISQIGIDPLKILFQAGTFLILFLIIRKFALVKIVNVLKERRETIEESLKNAHDIELERVEFEKRNEELLSKTRRQAHETIEASQKEAAAIVAEAESAASKRAEDIIANAHSQVDQAKEAARAEIKNELVDLVSTATEVIIDEKMTSAKDKQLIQRAVQTKGNKA
jgi:F-type H+-transporting ATPase subunit b